MDDAGGQLLAGAGCAADEDAAVGRRHAVDGLAQLVDGRRLADHVGAEAGALAQLLDLALELRGFQRPQRHEDQPVGLERLLDVVVGAAPDGGDCGLDVAVAGDDHHGQVGIGPLDVREHLEAIEPAALQPDVEDDQMRSALLDGAQGLVAVAGRGVRMTLVLENPGDQLANIGLVVDDQDVCSHLKLLRSIRLRPGGPWACSVGEWVVRARRRGAAGKRQSDAHQGAVLASGCGRRVLEGERAAVLLGDLLHNGKAETRALVALGRDVGLEQPGAVLLRQADAVVDTTSMVTRSLRRDVVSIGRSNSGCLAAGLARDSTASLAFFTRLVMACVMRRRSIDMSSGSSGRCADRT